MWKEGSTKVGNSIFHYWIKAYDEPSRFGIDGGKVSKPKLKRYGEIVYSYGRDEDVAPADKDTELAVQLLLHSENY